MEDNIYYLDSKLFNIGERMFGGKDMELGKVRYLGDSLLYLTDGSEYRCCGVFAGYLGLINDRGNTVFAKPVNEWKRKHNKVSLRAHIEIVEDYTKDGLLHKIVCEGMEILPAPSEPPKGIMFPAMLIGSLDGRHKHIAVYPQATPEAAECQYKELMRLIEVFKLKQRICDSPADNPTESSHGHCDRPTKTKLQTLRESLSISVSELAQKSGVSRGIIKKYELPENDIGNAKGAVLLALAKALNCTVEELMK